MNSHIPINKIRKVTPLESCPRIFIQDPPWIASLFLKENGGGGGGGSNSTPSSASAASPTENEDDSMLGNGYCYPPKEIKDIVDAPPLPAVLLSPHMDKILFLELRALPPLAHLARPQFRIHGKRTTRSRMSSYTGIVIHELRPDGKLGPEKKLHGIPDGANINVVTWSQDGRHLAFCVWVDDEENRSGKLAIWVADVETGKARPLFDQSPEICLEAVRNYAWVDNSTILVSIIPFSRGVLPNKPFVPSGPKIQSNEHKNIRTTLDLLKDEFDKKVFDHYVTTELVLASLDGRVKTIGPPAVYESLKPSPDGKYLMISSIHRSCSVNVVPRGRYPKKVDLWTTDGKFVRKLCDLPLTEDIPIGCNSVRKGMRSIKWREDKPSTLYWVKTQDGGDANVRVYPRDIVYTQPAEPLEGEQPAILHQLDLRYGGICWCDDSLALVSESWYNTRRTLRRVISAGSEESWYQTLRTRTWVISPGSKDASPRLLFDRSSEDVYSDPGSLVLWRSPAARYVIAKVNKENDGNTYVLLNGSGATPEGNIPFLDLIDINTGRKERIWQSDKNKYYETVVAFIYDQKEGDLRVDQLKLLISEESKTDNPQYLILSWRKKKASKISNSPHPYPHLALLQKEMIRYLRKDGVLLTATLYLPPFYDPSKDGPLPCLVWCDPDEFRSKDAAGQVRGSPNKFAGIGPTSPLLWLARRFAILSGPAIPIIGEWPEGYEEANGRYIEQLVWSAEAAVEEVIRRGVAHPNKIAVGGHSLGAFMTANLLAHAPNLFSCGVAWSGGYYRTLAPFGFENENRTPWQATTTPVEMSPFMSANRIKKPILLIHGEDDKNPHTLSMQSDYFFSALKDHDNALCRLVILPFESHVYTAKESIMHVLWETDRWLQKYCVSNTTDLKADIDASKHDISKEATVLRIFGACNSH
ncbi:probable glutamyl endopeptidase, chloroplastic [Corylus avellana]|uniref:probable glutamyl endopeptidase, chloroplastic n=1 Tax=Corylus avellana TaxID=13451 RepID=UPI00286A7156|nr:probable glutamyl endopeptidase, chloroplastic [Corylus avellana]